MTTCRSCHAEVIWVKVAPNNKRMPIDPNPDPAGNVLVDMHRRTAIVVSTEELKLLEEVGKHAPLYRSHFASCPQADRWRRKDAQPRSQR